MKSFLRRMAEFATGLTVAGAIWFGWLAVDRWLKYEIPVEAIFVAKVSVPDYVVGGNPVVVYSRDIKRDFIGAFSVEVKDLRRVTKCSGTASGIKYEQAETLDPTGKTLDWYIGTRCAGALPIGAYFLETTYTIQVEGLPVKYLTTTSNIFTVTEETK